MNEKDFKQKDMYNWEFNNLQWLTDFFHYWPEIT